MPDDILDAAQKAVNDAANAGAAAVDQPKPPEPVAPPPEPEPLPMTPPPEAPVPEPAKDAPEKAKKDEPAPVPVPMPVPAPASAVPVTPAADAASATTVADVLTPDSTIVPPVKPAKPGNVGKPKRKMSGAIIAVIITLLLALPVAVYYISQQNGPIADIRNRAWGTNYKQCTLGSGGNDQGSCPDGYVCHCQDGDLCTETKCEPEDGTKASCQRQGRDWCVNQHGYAMTCCYPQYHCCENSNGCCADTNPTHPPGSPPPDTATPTTPPNTPVCQNIKMYKNGAQVTDFKTLKAGDDVVLAVKGNLAPTKAHFRVNGKQITNPTQAGWTETTTQNAAGEFTIAYTIPENVNDFVIDAEVFTNGAWH